MRRRGIGSWTSAPPLFRVLWWLGWEVPPPHFLSHQALARLLGGWFGLFMLAFLCVFAWWEERELGVAGVLAAAVAASLGGALYGLWMAGYITRKVRGLSLPSWEQYREQDRPASPAPSSSGEVG